MSTRTYDVELPTMKGSILAKRFLVELVASAVLTFAFTVLFLYNLSLGLYDLADTSAIEDQVFLPYMQAFVVAIFAFVVYFAGSRFANYFVHANPIISIAYFSYTGPYLNRPTALLILVALLGQLVGCGLTTLIVWLLGDFRIFDAQQHLIGFESGTYKDLDAIQNARVWIAELVGVFGLGLLAIEFFHRFFEKYRNTKTRESQMRENPFLPYALGLSFYYFFYMILFWVHTRLSMDFIRAGWFCMFAALSGSEKQPCNPVALNSPDTTFYWSIFAGTFWLTFGIVFYIPLRGAQRQ